MLAAEDDNASTSIVVVSEQFWRSKLGSADLTGLRLDVNGHRFDVVGITPAPFRVCSAPLRPICGFHFRRCRWCARARRTSRCEAGAGSDGTGRLKPGVPIANALGEVQRISAQLVRDYPRNGANFTLVPAGNLPDDMRSDVSKVLLAFMCAAAAVLLITCANIASMSMARTTARGREVAIRQSLGAGKTSAHPPMDH